MSKHKIYDDVLSIRVALRRGFPPIVADHTSFGHRYKREDTGRQAWSVTTRLGFVNKGHLARWYAKKAVEHIREHMPRLLEGDLSVLDEAIGAGEKSRDDSAGIGTTAHGAIDRCLSRWIQEQSCLPVPAASFLSADSRGEEVAACRSFDLFLSEIEIIPVASETTVWFEQGRDCFAGTVDAVAIWNRPYKERTGSGKCGSGSFAKHDYARQPSGLLWCGQCGREVSQRLVLGDHKTSNTIDGKDDYAQQDVAYAKAITKASGIKIDEHWVIRYSKQKAEYQICYVPDPAQAWREFLAISRAFDEKMRRGDTSLLIPLIAAKEKILI